MKYIIFLSLSLVFFACDNSSNKSSGEKEQTTVLTVAKDGLYGQAMSDSESFETTQLSNLLADTMALNIKLSGEIDAVCQMSGCWVDIKMGDGNPLYVTFEEEAFTLPKDVAGKQVIVEGLAKKEIITVDYLKRQAKSEGKSQEEIDAITEPQVEYNFVARGVQINE